MPARFSDPAAFPYKAGTVLLGIDHDGNEIGFDPETHLITVASSGSGKGAALIVPNARRWAHNLLCIDPKGENARLSWQARQAMGQRVVVVDPYGYAKIPDELRASFNPLADIDPASSTAREQLEVVGDGMVRRADPKHAQWDDGAADLLAGVMAYVKLTAPSELQTLASVRAFLLQPNESIKADAEEMAQIEGFGGLCKAAALTLVTALSESDSMERAFLNAARRHSSWLDSEPIKAVLSASSFKLSDLKNGKLSLFLVLPPQYIATRAGFLRLFVRGALSAMMAEEGGPRCLFLLDEFYSLGRIEEIAKSAGIMRSYGVHLWPFLQDLNQLRELYGEGSGTFFANADAHLFFGNDQDPPALKFVSERLGNTTVEELVDGPPPRQPFEDVKEHYSKFVEGEARARHATDEQNRADQFRHVMDARGRPRVTPEQVASLTGKAQGEKLARSMIVFLKGGHILNLHLAAYFPTDARAPLPVRAPPPTQFQPPPAAVVPKRFPVFGWGLFLAVVAFCYMTAFPAGYVPSSTKVLMALIMIFVGFPLFVGLTIETFHVWRTKA